MNFQNLQLNINQIIQNRKWLGLRRNRKGIHTHKHIKKVPHTHTRDDDR